MKKFYQVLELTLELEVVVIIIINSINRNSFVVVVLPTTQIFKTKLMTLIQFTMQYQICTIHLVPTLVIVQL